MTFEDLKTPAECGEAGKPGVIGYTDSTEIPGVILRDGVPVYELVPGKFYPVSAAVIRKGRLVPILDVPQMEDVLIGGGKNE